MTREIVETLKRLLKARGMTYADLARGLGVSTPTVKRTFSQRSFTLERLEQVLRLLELDFQELARLSRGRGGGPAELSLEQETALAKDPRLFTVFWLLCNDWHFDRIVAEFRVGAAQITTYFARLERGLWIDDLPAAVAWMAADGVRFAPGGIPKGAAGHDICFIHPKASDEFPLGGEGVLIELVQAPPEVIAALSTTRQS